jgi:hypothetical protein
MKTTLDLPDEVVREMKLRAVMQRRTVKDLVTEYLRQGLGMAPFSRSEAPLSSPQVEIGEDGLPVIRCRSHAPATEMSVEDLLKLERETQTEEDLKRAGLPV